MAGRGQAEEGGLSGGGIRGGMGGSEPCPPIVVQRQTRVSACLPALPAETQQQARVGRPLILSRAPSQAKAPEAKPGAERDPVYFQLDPSVGAWADPDKPWQGSRYVPSSAQRCPHQRSQRARARPRQASCAGARLRASPYTLPATAQAQVTSRDPTAHRQSSSIRRCPDSQLLGIPYGPLQLLRCIGTSSQT